LLLRSPTVTKKLSGDNFVRFFVRFIVYKPQVNRRRRSSKFGKLNCYQGCQGPIEKLSVEHQAIKTEFKRNIEWTSPHLRPALFTGSNWISTPQFQSKF
jgi:hypothetical protein